MEYYPAVLARIFCTRALHVAFIALVAVSLPGCATLGGGGFNLISIEEEWEMGRQIEAELNRELQIVNDATTRQYIRNLGQRIVAETDMAHLPWSFHVVADGSLNAFNTPGGKVYVHTGLIAEADNVAELAGVMAHEVAHGVARHGTEQMSKAYGLSVGAGILLGSDPGIVQQIVAQIVSTGTMARFSRADEREADQMAVRFMRDAGYNPEGLSSFFEKLLAREQRSAGSLGQFFSTHPLTEERIEASRREARKLGNTSGLTTTDGQLRTVQQRIRQYN